MANVLAREVWTCSILNGAETAQFGWYLFSAAAADAADMAAGINGVSDPWARFRAVMPSSTVVTARELVETDVSTGQVLSTQSLIPPANPTGALGGALLPPQISEVVSIQTAVPGRSGRGRFYLPAVTAVQVTTAGRWATTNRDDVADGFWDYAVALVAASPVVFLGVYSRTLGAFAGVTGISVGDVFDTQRGRRRSLVEGRISFP